MSGVVVEGGCDTVEEHAVEWFAINSAELLGRFMVSYTYIRTYYRRGGKVKFPNPT